MCVELRIIAFINKDDSTINPNIQNAAGRISRIPAAFSNHIMNGEFPFSETDPLIDELKSAAFECLLLNPGSDFGDWQSDMIHNYASEVVDALGVDPEETFAALTDLWLEDYHDPATNIEQPLCTWAECFNNEASVGMYYYLVEAYKKLKKFNQA